MNAASYAVERTTEQPQASVVDIYWEACPPFIKVRMSLWLFCFCNLLLTLYMSCQYCHTHLQVLQSHLGQLLSNQLSDELRELCTSYESRNQGSVLRDIPTSEGGSDDVEMEANAYFHKMFSGQINIDVMIQMLASFKDSPDKRCISEICLKMICLLPV